ncbi:MAG: ATP-grasp domain-containing protein [Acidimicrobiales bacterium]
MNGSAELGTAVAGAALVGAALTWRLTARRGARNAIRSALRSPERESRLAALHIIASEGVASYSSVLRERAGAETDPEIRRTLAEVVARAQWEPAADEALVELRLWAHRQLAKASDGPAVEPESGDGAADGAGEGAPPVEPRWWRLAPKDPSPATVLVTGAGGPAGVAVIRWLRASGHRVVAADVDPLAVGLRLGDEYALIERFSAPGYVASLCRAATAAGATAVVPTVAEEFVAIAAEQDALEQAGVAALVPDPDRVLDCTDKWRFAKVTQAADVPVPPTNLGSADGVPAPWVIKPRFGRGSRDVVLADDDASLAYALSKVPDPIVQSRVPGREFTVDVLLSPAREVVGAVPRWRLQTRGGISTRGETFANGKLVTALAKLLEALELVGAANVQGFVAPNGSICFVEVNPRFSGGLPLSLAAGADLVGEYVRGVRGMAMRPERCVYRPGVTMMRYFEDVFES